MKEDDMAKSCSTYGGDEKSSGIKPEGKMH
jgi:hypothetical protein